MQHRDSIRDSMASAEFILPEEFITETLNVNQNQKSNSVTTANSADSNNIMFRNMIQHLIKPDSNDVYEKTDPKTSADKSLQDLLEQSKQAETNAVKCVTTANSVDSNSIMFRNMIQHLIKPDSVDVYEKTDPKTAADKSLQDLLEQSKQAETNAVKCEHNIFIEFFHDDQMDTLYKERIKEFIATVNNMDLPFLRKKKRKLSKKIRKASTIKKLSCTISKKPRRTSIEEMRTIEKTFDVVQKHGLFDAALKIDPEYRLLPIVCSCGEKCCDCILYTPYLNKLQLDKVPKKRIKTEPARYLCPTHRNSNINIMYQKARKRFFNQWNLKNIN